jgi:amino acid transporter
MENKIEKSVACELPLENRGDVTKKNSKQEEISLKAQTECDKETEERTSDKNVKEYKPSEKWRIMKNIVVISLAFMVHFTAFQGAGNLQSSVNAVEGLGTASLATIYFSLILSNVFLPVVMIRSVVYNNVFLFQENEETILIVTQISDLQIPFRHATARRCNHKYSEPKFFLHFSISAVCPSRHKLFYFTTMTIDCDL